MSVKSYKLKIIIPSDRLEIREWLWNTHVLFNRGVKYLLRQLFLMRRGKGWGRRLRDGSVEWVPNQELLNRFIGSGKSSKEAEELAEACRQIYEHNFPKSSSEENSVDGEGDQEGGAQAARGLYGPLTNSESTGLGLAGLEKIAKNLRKAIESPESVKDPDSIRFESGGRSPAHYNVFREWQSKGMKKNSLLRQKFIDKAEGYLKANVDKAELLFRKNLQRVREALGGRVFEPVSEYLKLLPDVESGFGEEMSPEWELGMFTQAFERLLTHEGWVSRRRKEREEQERELRFKLEGGWEDVSGRDEKVKESPKRITTEPKDLQNWKRIEGARNQPWYLRLREYEEKRTTEDGLSSRQGSREKVGIDGGMTKGWGRIRPFLLKALEKGKNSKEQLTQVLNRYQTENPTRFGDGRLFRWLLEDGNRFIWSGDRDYLRDYLRLKPRPMRSITWTDPDPRFHPLWTRFGPSSAVPYSLDKKLGSVTLKLLVPHPSKVDFFSQLTVEGIPLAPYEKFHGAFKYFAAEPIPGVKKGQKKESVSGATELTYSDDLLAAASATTKGARLMFDRHRMERRRDGVAPAEAYLNFSCEIKTEAIVPWEREWLYSTRLQFENPLRKEVRQDGFARYRWPYSLMVDGRKKLDAKNGVRVLSIDLGLRHGAAWAFWGLSLKEDSYHPQASKSMVSVQAGASEDGEVVYAHLIERGLLDLPGEGAELPDEMKKLKEEIWAIKRELNVNKQLLWVASKLTETSYTTIERKESFKKRGSGKGFRHKWIAVKTHHPYSPEQLRTNVLDAAEGLLELKGNDEVRQAFSGLTWPSAESPDDEAARAKFTQAIQDKSLDVANQIFLPQKPLHGLSGKERKAIYQPNSVFWKRDMFLKDEVRVLWKKMREKKRAKGGLSAERLAALSDFYDLLKAWTFRPRRPGERRHMSEDQGFAIKDRDHLQALKDDRIKKLSFLITARALGYEPNLSTGLWKYIGDDGKTLWQRPESEEFFSDEKGKAPTRRPKELGEMDAKRPHPVGPSCHLIVFENLTRYRFRQDRPKNENSQLMKWSHREIFHFTRQAAELYGLRTGMAYAAFSSQYCSFCGAAGSRVTQVPPSWFPENQAVAWLKRMMGQVDDKGNPTDKAKELSGIKPGDWISWPSGEHFLCSNEKCPQGKKPVNADENAASNIGRRFLQGVPPDFRLTCETASDGFLKVKSGDWKGRLLKQVSGVSWVISEDEKGKRKKPVKQEPLEDLEDGMEPGEDGVKILFTDPVSFKGRWMESKVFWGQVRRNISKRLQVMK